jgi:hypothetical protein
MHSAVCLERCQCLTKKGVQCARPVVAGGRMCRTHAATCAVDMATLHGAQRRIARVARSASAARRERREREELMRTASLRLAQLAVVRAEDRQRRSKPAGRPARPKSILKRGRSPPHKRRVRFSL